MSDDDNADKHAIKGPEIIKREKPTKVKGKAIRRDIEGQRLSKAQKHATIVELTAKQVSPAVIAQAVDMPISTVKSVIRKFEGVFRNLGDVEDYRNAKADILSAGQLVVLRSALSEKKVDKAGFLSLLQGFEILNKAERLDLGKSTENVNSLVFGKLDITGLLSSPVLDNCSLKPEPEDIKK